MSDDEDQTVAASADSPSSSSSSSSSPPPAPTATTFSSPAPAQATSIKVLPAIESLSQILHEPLPPTLSDAHTLLHDPQISRQISALLRRSDSGSGDNNLCRWLYDTFQSSDPDLQLVVLRYIPTMAGVYLCRVAKCKPQAGFEAVLLALYAHETTSRHGQAVTMNVPDLSQPYLYHETKTTGKNNSTSLNLAIVSLSLETHGTVRSTRRARIVGVALELYYSKIFQMPYSSKLEFCELCYLVREDQPRGCDLWGRRRKSPRSSGYGIWKSTLAMRANTTNVEDLGALLVGTKEE